MIQIEMTEEDAKAFLVILDQASQEFGNHGCNDFNVAQELKLSKDQAEKVAKGIRARMVEDKVLDQDAVNDRGTYLYDWALISWLKRKIETALTSASG